METGLSNRISTQRPQLKKGPDQEVDRSNERGKQLLGKVLCLEANDKDSSGVRMDSELGSFQPPNGEGESSGHSEVLSSGVKSGKTAICLPLPACGVRVGEPYIQREKTPPLEPTQKAP